MTIHIHDLPDLGFVQVRFDLVVPRDVNRMEGRRTESRIYGTPYWEAQYRTRYLEGRPFGKAESFIRKILSRGGVFKAHDVLRPRPIEAGSTPLTWSPSIVSIDDEHTITITGVGDSFQFREGDPVSLKASSLVVSLHTITADAVAGGSPPDTVTLSVVPAIDSDIFSTSAEVIFEKPYCLMQPTDWSANKELTTRDATWSAQEVFFYETEDGSPGGSP